MKSIIKEWEDKFYELDSSTKKEIGHLSAEMEEARSSIEKKDKLHVSYQKKIENLLETK